MLALAMCSLSDTTIMKETAAVLQPAPSLGAYLISENRYTDAVDEILARLIA